MVSVDTGFAQDAKNCAARVVGTWAWTQSIGGAATLVVKADRTAHLSAPMGSEAMTWTCSGNSYDFNWGRGSGLLTLSPDGRRLSGRGGGIVTIEITAVRTSAPPPAVVTSPPPKAPPAKTTAPAPGLAQQAPPKAAGAEALPDADCARAETHWKSAEGIKSRAVYEDHLTRFPACEFAGLARARLEAMKR
jgi:hypothetical protein